MKDLFDIKFIESYHMRKRRQVSNTRDLSMEEGQSYNSFQKREGEEQDSVVFDEARQYPSHQLAPNGSNWSQKAIVHKRGEKPAFSQLQSNDHLGRDKFIGANDSTSYIEVDSHEEASYRGNKTSPYGKSPPSLIIPENPQYVHSAQMGPNSTYYQSKKNIEDAHIEKGNFLYNSITSNEYNQNTSNDGKVQRYQKESSGFGQIRSTNSQMESSSSRRERKRLIPLGQSKNIENLDGEMMKQMRQSKKIPAIRIKVRSDEIVNLNTFCSLQIPKGKYLEALLKRTKSCFGASYDIVLTDSLRPLLKFEKGWSCLGAHYSIKCLDDATRHRRIADVEGNCTGSIFNVYSSSAEDSQILATIRYISSCNLKKIIRIFQVYIKSDLYSQEELDGYDPHQFQNLYQLYPMQRIPNKIYKFINRQPEWNEEHEIYMLNFRGKAKVASVKNFILERESTKQEALLFTKIDDHSFYLEAQNPLSPRVIGGILASVFTWKLYMIFRQIQKLLTDKQQSGGEMKYPWILIFANRIIPADINYKMEKLAQLIAKIEELRGEPSHVSKKSLESIFEHRKKWQLEELLSEKYTNRLCSIANCQISIDLREIINSQISAFESDLLKKMSDYSWLLEAERKVKKQ